MTAPQDLKDLEFAGFRLSPARRQLLGPDGQEIDLKPKVFDTLAALAARSGQVTTKNELMNAVWPDIVVEENNLNQAISSLRKALGDNGKRLIATVPGRGYQLAAKVTFTDSPPPTATAAPVADGAMATNTRKLPPKRLAMIVAAALVVLFAGLGVWNVFARPAAEPSVAVLPFANFSSDRTKDYFGQGLAMEIIDTLSQIKGVEVVSRNSSLIFSADTDPLQVGRRLGVAHVLSGSVLEQGNQVEISAQLANAKNGRAIWTRKYAVQLTTDDLYAVHRQIAEQVSGAMSITFDVDSSNRLPGTGTAQMEAYDFYLRGLEQWWIKADFGRSVEAFQQAVKIDPDYAEAWAGLAIATASSGWAQVTPARARAQQDAAYGMAQRAFSLNPDSSIVVSTLGAVATTQYKWSEADTATVRGIELSRNDQSIANRLFLLQRVGRLQEAYAMMNELWEIDPLRGPGDLVTTVAASVGRADEVKAILAQPEWSNAASLSRRVNVLASHIHIGAAPETVRQGLEALSKDPDVAAAALARALLGVFDNPERARAALQAWYEDESLPSPYKSQLTAHLAAWYGDTDLVLRAWRDELPVNMLRTVYIWGPAFQAVRPRPEFKALVRDIGFVEYWRAHGWADKCRPLPQDDFECV